MGKLTAFSFITLNGFYKGPDRDISWHRHGAEENEFAVGNLKSGATLLFGRVTYELMAAYWPTPDALRNDPEVARGINEADKIVFSRTLKKVGWKNTRLVNRNIVEEIKTLKKITGKDMTLLGSGSILTILAEAGLVDEYQIMVDPVVLGEGTPVFAGITKKLDLKLASVRTFKSGVVLLYFSSLISNIRQSPSDQ